MLSLTSVRNVRSCYVLFDHHVAERIASPRSHPEDSRSAPECRPGRRRVERDNQTLQDRLVKELRLRGIDTIDAANDYAQEFITDFNARFGKAPRNPKDMHRALAAHKDLDSAMCRKEIRTLSQSLTLRYEKVIFILDPTERATALAGQKVIVCDYPDSRLEIMHESFTLTYRTFDTLRSVQPVACG